VSKKIIKNVTGMNLANFVSLGRINEEEDELGVDLTGFTGVQWDNGVGKGYLKNIIVLGLSTRLNYNVGLPILSTPESSELYLPTSANASRDLTIEEKARTLDVRLSEVFNERTYKVSNKSFIFIEFSDGHISITHPTTDIKYLNRLHIMTNDEFTPHDAFTFIKEHCEYQDMSVKESLVELRLRLRALSIPFEFEDNPKTKSEYIKKNSLFYLGYDSSKSHGEMVLLGVSDKTISVLNDIIVSNGIDRAIELSKKPKSKDDEESRFDNFLFRKSLLQVSIEKLLKLKETDSKLLISTKNKIDKLLDDSSIDGLVEEYTKYNKLSKKASLEIKSKKDNLLKLNKELSLMLDDEKQKSYKIDEDRINLNTSLKSLRSFLLKIETSMTALEFPEKSMIDIKSKIDELDKRKLNLDEKIKISLSIEEQREKKRLTYKEITNKLRNRKVEVEKVKTEIKERSEQFKNKDKLLFSSGKANQAVKFALCLTDSMKILTSDISDLSPYEEISRIVNQNPKHFNETYRNILNRIQKEESMMVSEISFKEAINTLNRKLNSLINDIDRDSKERDTLESEMKDLKDIESKFELENKIIEISKELNTMLDNDRIMKGINDGNQISSMLTSTVLKKLFETDFSVYFSIELTEDNIQIQLDVLKKMIKYALEEVSKNKETKITHNKRKIELSTHIDNNLKLIQKIDYEFMSIKDISSIDEFIKNMGAEESTLNRFLDIKLSEEDTIEKTYIRLSELYRKTLKKNDNFKEFFYSLGELSQEFNLEMPRSYFKSLLIYNGLKRNIISKLSSLEVSTKSALAYFNFNLSETIEFYKKLGKDMESKMKIETDIISKITCSTGQKYAVKNNSFLEKTNQETSLMQTLNKIFNGSDIYNMSDVETEDYLYKANKDDLRLFLELLYQIGSSDGVTFDISKFLLDKSNKFTFKLEGVSTGNDFVINVGVRQHLLAKNERFMMTTFIDEFSSIGIGNFKILFSQDMVEPVTFFQNSYSDFDKVREHLHHTNSSSAIPMREGDLRQRFRSEIIWVNTGANND